MFKSIFILLLVLCSYVCEAQNNRNIDPCQIFGTVYVEKKREDATFRVYLEESDAFANIVVYKQTNKLYADKTGFWYFTEARGFADFSIYIESNKALADFTIYYTNTESFAGCK